MIPSFLIIGSLLASSVLAAARKNLIIDTDLFSDVDDVEALLLAMTHPSANLLALNLNVASRYTARAASALLGYYHHGHVPLGVPRPLTNATFFDSWKFELGEYASKIAYHYRDYAAIRWDAGAENDDAVILRSSLDPVDLYRKVLAEAEDGSVTICSIGFLDNGQVSALFNSTADKHSPLTGHDLLLRKVASVVIMGGSYPSGREFNFFGTSRPYATAHFVNTYPGDMTFSGLELGAAVFSGKALVESGPENDPTRRGYLWYTYGRNSESWDPLTMLYALEGLESGLFAYERGDGHNHVFANGSNEWRASDERGGKQGKQRRLKLQASPEAAGKRLDGLYLAGAWQTDHMHRQLRQSKDEL